MAVFQEIISQIDKGISPEFAASLAGLSLAAAAFFFPGADNILKETKERMNNLEIKIAKGEKHGYTKTQLTDEYQNIEKVRKNTKAAQEGLIKAFLIFTWFLVYTISIDQIIDINFFKDIIKYDAQLLENVVVSADVAFSIILLGWAGKNLWRGAIGIQKYFNVSFDEDREKVKQIFDKLK